MEGKTRLRDEVEGRRGVAEHLDLGVADQILVLNREDHVEREIHAVVVLLHPRTHHLTKLAHQLR